MRRGREPRALFLHTHSKKRSWEHSVMVATYKLGSVLTGHQILLDIDLGLSSFLI